MNGENLVGNILNGRYEVLEKIGTGGMAVVYKAKDMLLNRFVAVKVLRDSLEGENKVVENFMKEAQAAAKLAHNNIVSVYDVGEDDGINYMVMELVDGITLKQYIKEKGALPWQEACDYAIQIGQGIGEAHSQNIIHRDIKPQNIIMTKDKTLKVTDFGIAKAVASETTVVGGTAMGSVHYISPEQARGGFTDARSDIYSLGIVLYEMLTGKVPFDGDTAVSVALMHLEKDPVNVRCVKMDIPTDLAYVTMKAIEKEQAKRYQNVGEMLDDLHAVLADEPLPSMDNEESAKSAEVPQEEETSPEEAAAAAVAAENAAVSGSVDDSADAAKATDISDTAKHKKEKKEKVPKTKEQKKADKKATVFALLTVVVILLIAAGIYFFMFTGSERAVPDLSNITLEQATQKAKSAGFTVSDDIEYSLSDTVSEGNVIAQDPTAKKLAKKNIPIKLVVSIGSSGGNIDVPDVVNKDFDAAISTILDSGLTYWVVEEYSDTVAANIVIRQTPEKGTKVNKDDIVTIHVSKGRKPASSELSDSKDTIPNVVGVGKDDAEATLEEHGFILGTVTRKASSLTEGTVISQSPVGGKSAVKGSAVSIIISSGNEHSTEPASSSQNANKSGGETKATAAPAVEATAKPTAKPKDLDSSEKSAADTGSKSSSGSSDSGSSQSQSGAKTQTYTVKIPDAAGDSVNIEIVANGRTVHNALHKKSEGSVSVEINGTGTVSVQAYVDGAKVSDDKLEF